MKYLVIILLLIFVSCQGQINNDNHITKINDNLNNENVLNEKIEKLLKKQLEYGASAKNEVTDISTGYIFEEEDINVESILIKKILDNNNYKTNQDKFNEKIINIFGIKQKKHFHINLLKSKCKTELNHDIFDFPFEQIYVIPDKQIIFPIFLLPELIDYQKDYPNMKLLEDKVIKDFVRDGYKVNIKLWKEVKDLSQRRNFNKQLLISRNKYLFNDDKSHFPWLVTHDEYFMESLVTVFGYTEDKRLLEWAFKKQGFKYVKYPSDKILENFGKFLWTKQCNGEIKIHDTTLNLIKELLVPSSQSGNEVNILYLAEYINYLSNEDKDIPLDFSQKAKLIATLLAFGEQYKYNKEYGYNQMFLGKFIHYQDIEKKYKKEFEKNNYYNIPNLKKWFLEAEQEKDMFENDQTLSDDPQPMDYLYKATYKKGPFSK
ncbi:hypothetical protein GYM73_05980 [Apibacter sp. ESL0432]|uniref:hypothetical protein n=1 Tax=Apibacter sp. ESL0432 TaxID=2704652 RepID=UPI001C6A524F|nr:hypothetical protein [Apibacter sp. ESL0432]QYN49173.1 hypothetical protein GYM73_05980 [Apibacter sp. ESL0432]